MRSSLDYLNSRVFSTEEKIHEPKIELIYQDTRQKNMEI